MEAVDRIRAYRRISTLMTVCEGLVVFLSCKLFTSLHNQYRIRYRHTWNLCLNFSWNVSFPNRIYV